MAKWFECKVRYDKALDNGAAKKVTEPFLVDALSCTEAEARITEERQPFISGDFSVNAVKATPIAEIFRQDDCEDSRWYLVKAAFISIDEKTAKERRTVTQFLVEAASFKDAFDNFLAGMAGTLADFEIVCIQETAYIDVYDARLGTVPEA